MRWPLAIALLPGCLGLGQNRTVVFEPQPGSLQIGGRPGEILLDGREHWGVIRAAGDFASDVGKVTGQALSVQIANALPSTGKYEYRAPDSHRGKYSASGPARVLDVGDFGTSGASANTVIIAGTIGSSDLIDSLVRSGTLDVGPIRGRWEAYVRQVVDSPVPGVERALVIAGSDRRGTTYGLYDLSEQMGVSPFYWWADVVPHSHEAVHVLPVVTVQKSPSIKYRGFFLNDEAPALANWVDANFERTPYGAGFNGQFYSKVFELVLRLKANYLWPAMWSSMFCVDDDANLPLADAFGVVMGTSHTEPLLRATHEWPRFGDGVWQWNLNNGSIRPYFELGVERAKPYEGIYNLAMRGFDDFAMDLPQEEAVRSLLDVVAAQRDILQTVNPEKSLAEIPQMWCIYKEVLGYFEGGMSVPDDVILLWSDDNWGNIRRLPVGDETDRPGGAGLYYHFDYVGDPRSYKWINTVSLARTWEQLHLAYQRQATEVWIVNVGDLKPMELPMSFYFDLAYDFDRWTADSLDEWTQLWAEREFGAEVAAEVADIVSLFSQYAAWRKFELLDPQVYSVVNYREADIVLEKWTALAARAQAVYDGLSEAIRPSFFELVQHPVQAGLVVYRIYINSARNNLYSEQQRSSANTAASLVLQDFKADRRLTNEFHALLDGKWNHMMDQTHLGYQYWQQPMRDSLPPLSWVQDLTNALTGEAGLGVEGSYAAVPGDDRFHALSGSELTVPPMDPFGPESRYVDVFSRGPDCSSWRVTSDMPAVSVVPSTGIVCGGDAADTRAEIYVDWSQAPAGSSSARLDFYFSHPSHQPHNYGSARKSTVTVVVPLNKTVLPEDFVAAYVESDGHVSIEAEHFTRNVTGSDVTYVTLPHFGHTLSGVTLWPVLADTQEGPLAPRLEYDFFSFTDCTNATLTVYCAPSHNFNGPTRKLRYTVAIDSQPGQTVQVVPDAPAGELPPDWEDVVSDNVRKPTSVHSIGPGFHTLRLQALEPGVVFQKIVVDLGGVRPSYFGPPESRFVKAGQDEDDSTAVPQQIPLVVHQQDPLVVPQLVYQTLQTQTYQTQTLLEQTSAPANTAATMLDPLRNLRSSMALLLQRADIKAM